MVCVSIAEESQQAFTIRRIRSILVSAQIRGFAPVVDRGSEGKIRADE
jgi:hypothetical protein